MKRPLPFLIVPWQEDFLQALLRLALAETEGDIGKAVFIFPHSRPKRYLSLLLYQEPSVPRPLLMPRMHTVSSLFATLSGRILARPAWTAGLLDRVGLLLNCVRQEAEQDDTPFLTDARLFFPWGVRLASLFEECFSQHRKPGNFLHMEDQVSPFAAMLLARLGGIFSRYETALRDREWTTPGFDAALTADYLLANAALPEGALPANGRIYIAGFHALSGAENILFKRLWERERARVVLHADPALAGNESAAHWSCKAFPDWARAWSASLEPLPARSEAQALPERRIRYYAGFDLHSQLSVLEKELTGLASGPAPEPEHCNVAMLSPNTGSRGIIPLAGSPEGRSPSGRRRQSQSKTALAPEPAGASTEDAALDANFPGRDPGDPAGDYQADTVIALPDSGLLMPVLHHLPPVDVNISMGYPLARSPLFRLVDTLARLQENRKVKGYYWRDLVDLIRHPYLKMLLPRENAETPANGAAGPGTAAGSAAGLFRRELHRLERTLRENGRKYADPFAVLEALYQSLDPADLPTRPVLALLEELLRTTLTAFSAPARPKDLAESLEGLCSFLLTYGAHLWRRFPIDAECLYRLRQSLIPELAHSVPAEERFAPETLFAILRSLLQAERVPFEAAPLVGLQVMGMLETRLLSFRRVIIVDAVEESLPGSPVGDPLLPEALRLELGLPPLHSREQVAAYNFFRLVAGAEEIALLWQEGADAPGIQEQKKKKSRFVEELLWEEEKRLGRLLRPGGRDGPLTVLASTVTPVPRTRAGIPVTPPVRALIHALLKRPVSASLLDSYLHCPARFFHERLVRLTPADEVIEGDDPLAVGDLFHHVLQAVYDGHLRSPLPGGEALVAEMGPDLLETFFAAPGYAALSRNLPADSLAMLGCAARKRLTDFLRNQPPTTVLALETPLRASFLAGENGRTLTGKADRIDARLNPDVRDEEHEAGAGIVILDYKTGRIPAVSPDLWEETSLWERMARWQPAACSERAPDVLLGDLARRMESVQLPFYLLLYSLASRQGSLPAPSSAVPALPLLDAHWVALGDSGAEIPLLPLNYSLEQRREIVEQRIPALVHFLLRHMLESPVLAACPGRHCDWCSSAKLCIVPVA